MMKCKRCGSTEYEMRRDDRNVAHAYCKDCNTHIKIMTAGELVDYYEAKLAKIIPPVPPYEGPAQPEPEPETSTCKEPDQPLCKYCTERYVMVQGNPSVRQQYVPMDDIKYCPMCGRRLREDDRKY